MQCASKHADRGLRAGRSRCAASTVRATPDDANERRRPIIRADLADFSHECPGANAGPSSRELCRRISRHSPEYITQNYFCATASTSYHDHRLSPHGAVVRRTAIRYGLWDRPCREAWWMESGTANHELESPDQTPLPTDSDRRCRIGRLVLPVSMAGSGVGRRAIARTPRHRHAPIRRRVRTGLRAAQSRCNRRRRRWRQRTGE